MTEESNLGVVDSVLWDLKTVSIFFEKPLEVEIYGEIYTVGTGLGGFSWSMFQRGFDCTGCGNCCAGTSGTFNRSVWSWYDNEPRPEGLEPLIIAINGQPLQLWLHRNVSTTQCDFLGERSWKPAESMLEEYQGHNIQLVLNEKNEVPIQYCTIHGDESVPSVRPAHCYLYPGAAVFPTGKAKKPLLSRRLPGRNWRWPQCPIEATSVPLRQSDIENDKFVFSVFYEHLKDIPFNHLEMGLGIWESFASAAQHGIVPRESIYFIDYL